MRLNRPPVLICFKSYSNRLLIDFYDLNLAADFTRRDDPIRIRIRILSLDSIYVENWSNCIENWSIYIKKVIFFDINRRF